MKKLRNFAVAILAVAVVATTGLGMSAQRRSAQKPMTNQDVLDMVQAKLSTDLIVTTVENASSPGFDVQAATIISLKRAGVDDRIVQAMVKVMNPGRSRGAAAPSTPY